MRRKPSGPMTYCVGLLLDTGIVFASDSRTNAGMDNFSSFRKMHVWTGSGDRVLVLLSAGNLALTQSVIALLNEAIVNTRDDTPTLETATSMVQVARTVGGASRKARSIETEGQSSGTGYTASFILGGQIKGEPPRLFQIYREGNFIEITGDTPYVQIGELKYGKPILDRLVDPAMALEDAAKLVLLSFDSTMRSNLSVGMPLDVLLYRADSFSGESVRLAADDAYFHELSRAWSSGLRSAFDLIPPFPR